MLPDLNLTIKPEFEHQVMLKCLFALYVQSQTLGAITMEMYAKTTNHSIEETGQIYKDLSHKNAIEFQALFAKWGELDIR